MKRRLSVPLFLLLLTVGQNSFAACEGIPLQTGFQLGLGVHTYLMGNQKDFELVAPGYAVSGGYSFSGGLNGLYLTAVYGSSNNFSLVSAEGVFRHVIETPFMSVFGQIGAFAMTYATLTSVRHNLAGGVGGMGLILLFSDAVEFDFVFKGYLHTESFLSIGGTFLFRL